MVLAGVGYAAGIPLGLVHNYYGPAVYAMAHSWEAWFWGAQDTQAMLTLDKLPGAFQLQALSARVFGYSTWSVLLPQVVAAVAAVGVLFATVRRWLGPRAALAAATVLATTPVVAALAHSQIVDTWLMFLLICAAWAWTRAVQSGRLGWLVLCGALVGAAFNVKMVQAWGVLPALAVAYWLFAPGTKRRRTGHVLVAGVVTAVVSLWWLVVASVVPADRRPWIDGSASNSAWAMVFGYNLFSRYTEGGGTPGGTGGWSYLFTSDVATQVGWLYPLALLGFAGGLWWLRSRPRTDPVRAGVVMWGVWLVTHALAFSLGRVAHSFYVEALAPAVAALAVAGVVLSWRAWRAGHASGWLLPAGVAASLAWTVWLQTRYPDFLSWLVPTVVVLGVVGLAALLAQRFLRTPPRAVAPAAAGALAASLLITPAAWAASTTQLGYSGSNIGPAAGPVQSMGGGGGMPRGGGAGGGRPPGGAQGGTTGAVPPGAPGATAPGAASSGDPGAAPTAPGNGRPDDLPASGQPGVPAGQGFSGPGGATRGAGGQPGVGEGQAAETLAWIRAHNPGTRFELAVVGSQGGGEYVLAGGAVLPIGGFTGSIPNVTAEQLAAMVSAGELHHVLLGGGGGQGRDRSGDAELTTWVTEHCEAATDAPVSGLYVCE